MTRQAVADAARRPRGQPGRRCCAGHPRDLASATDTLTELHLPVGWEHGFLQGVTWTMVIGWAVTALMVMLGGPFWFDLLSRLMSLRTSGNRPPTAENDPMSAVSAMTARQRGASEPRTTGVPHVHNAGGVTSVKSTTIKDLLADAIGTQAADPRASGPARP